MSGRVPDSQFALAEMHEREALESGSGNDAAVAVHVNGVAAA